MLPVLSSGNTLFQQGPKDFHHFCTASLGSPQSCVKTKMMRKVVVVTCTSSRESAPAGGGKNSARFILAILVLV
jgi:hypothetical protein